MQVSGKLGQNIFSFMVFSCGFVISATFAINCQSFNSARKWYYRMIQIKINVLPEAK